MFDFLRRKKTDPKKQLLKVLGQYSLPTFSAIAQEVLTKLRDPDATPSTISDTLSGDPGLSVDVLRRVNSAAFGLRKSVDNLTQAIALLGMSNVESLVLSVVVSKCLPKVSAPGYDPKRFWFVSARRATIARALARQLHPSTAAQAYTAGLLQDMAVPLLASQRPDDYGPLLEKWHQDDADLVGIERESMGWDHAEVATWIANEWDLPASLAEAIGSHHNHAEETEVCPPAVRLVALLRECEPDGTERLVDAAVDMGITRHDVTKIIEESKDPAEELARAFG